MSNLPANKSRAAKHASMMFLIGGLESLTRALVMGDGFEDVEGLREIGRRAQALSNAIEARIQETDR